MTRFTSFIFLNCFFISPAYAQDSRLNFVAAFSFQDKKLDFNQQYSGAAENRANFSVHLPMLNAALTAIYGKWFFTAKFEETVSNTSSATTETDRSVLLESNLIAVSESDTDVTRSGSNFSIGYGIAANTNIFIGYLDGETELTPDPFCANPTDSIPCSRTNRAFQQFFIGDQGFVSDQPTYRQNYTESGPFFGASYTLPTKKSGSFTFSFAYASMDGEYKDNANDPENVFADPGSGTPTFVSFNYKGDTKGTSIALTWSRSLGSNSAAFLDVRRQKYEMDGEDVTGLINFNGVSLSTEEEMVGMSMGLRFYF